MELFQNGNEALAHLTNYANSQRYLQTISNPAGLMSSDVLGKTKFCMDQTAFAGAWSRPQRDGSALRAASLRCFGQLPSYGQATVC
jgi:glucoamylase